MPTQNSAHASRRSSPARRASSRTPRTAPARADPPRRARRESAHAECGPRPAASRDLGPVELPRRGRRASAEPAKSACSLSRSARSSGSSHAARAPRAHLPSPRSRGSRSLHQRLDLRPRPRVQDLVARQPRPPRLARSPISTYASAPTLVCAVLETTTLTPASPASRACASRRSSRSGCELISRNVPVSSARSTTRSMSTSAPAAHVDLAGSSGGRCSRRAGSPSRRARRSGRVAVEAGVQRGDHPVAARRASSSVDVERAVGADVHLDPAQDPERREPARPAPRSPPPGCASRSPRRRCE